MCSNLSAKSSQPPALVSMLARSAVPFLLPLIDPKVEKSVQ